MEASRALLVACERRGDDAAAHEVLKRMKARGIQADASCYEHVLGSCVKPRNARRADSILEEMRNEGVPIRAEAYRRLAALHARRMDEDRMLEIVRNMRKQGLKLEASIATRACSVLGKHGRWREGLHVMEMLEEDGGKMDCMAYNASMDACSREGRLDACLMLLQRMQLEGLQADVYTYTGVIHASTKARCPEMALEIFEDMSKQVEPDLHAYTALIGALGQTGDGKRASALFQEMKGRGIIPSHRTYATVIQSQCSSSDHEDAMNFFREWKELHMLNDPELRRGSKSRLFLGKSGGHVVSALVGVLGQGEDASKVLDLIARLKKEKIVLDIVAYNHVMEIYSKHGEWKECLTLLDTIETYGLVPNLLTFETITKACLKAKRLDDALLVQKRMSRQKIQPSKKLRNWIIQALAREGRCSEAVRSYVGLQQDGLVEYETYHAILRVLARSGFPLKAEEVLKTLHERGMMPERVSYMHIIEAYGKRGMLKDAMRLFHSMKKLGLDPDVATYAALIRACSYSRDIRRATLHFEEMQSKGLYPNTFTWNAMLTACSRSGSYDLAEELYRQFQDRSTPRTRPNFWTYSLMVNMYGKGGKLEEARNLFEDMDARGLLFDAAAFNSLMNAYVVHGLPHEAMELYDKMCKRGIVPTAPTRTIVERAERLMEDPEALL